MRARTLRRALVSAFCVLNVAAVLAANQPPDLRRDALSALERSAGARSAWRLAYAEWALRWYAHKVGLDNRWTMFSRLPRFDWWYRIEARDADGSTRLLSLPLQSERSFAQRHFADFKETKFQLNVYDRPWQRRAYGRYLCRTADGSPDAVVFRLHTRAILPREEAAARGDHRGEASVRTVQEVRCPR